MEDTDPEERATVSVTVRDGQATDRFAVECGTVLRDALLERGLSPYTALTERANCGGRGICATCGVRVESGPAPAGHWHDRLADRFGYPRLSCQVRVTDDIVVSIPDKRVWGRRKPDGEGGD